MASMSWLERYSREEIKTKGDIVGDSEDDHASAHSPSIYSAANTVVMRLTPPFSMSPIQIEHPEHPIFNLLPNEPPELAHLRYPDPIGATIECMIPPGSYEDHSLKPPARKSLNLWTQAMKPTLATTEWYLGGTVTPNVDDTPYLRYALNQISKEDSDGSSDTLRVRDASWESSWSEHHDEFLPEKPDHVYYTKRPGRPLKKVPHYSYKASSSSLALAHGGDELYLAIDPAYHAGHASQLSFLPLPLRSWALALLALALTLMTAGLMFCTEYSRRNPGLWEHTAAFDGRYVLFRYLGPTLGAGLYVWIEVVLAATYRISPYRQMTSEDRQIRHEAIFHNPYPTTFLLPRLSYLTRKHWPLGLSAVLFLPFTLSIPLASALFTTTLSSGTWYYTASIPVSYTMAAIYILALVSSLILAYHFHRPCTGLHSDPRTIASFATLLSRANALDAYRSSELLSKSQLKVVLRDTAHRLGYWRTTSTPRGVFYGIGCEGAPGRRFVENGNWKLPVPRVRDSLDPEAAAGWEGERKDVRHAYLPWFLHRISVLVWPVLFGVAFVAMLVVSFLPSTALITGFPPRTKVQRDANGFSASNFLWALIPSVIGMLLYGGMQKLFHTLCRLYPWAELSRPGGATAGESILLDYSAASSVPFTAVPAAVANGHWVVVVMGIMTPLSLVLAILGGGMLMTYTALPSEKLLVFPDERGFYVLIGLLGLYLLTFCFTAQQVWAMGDRLRMPKKVECVADLISFLYASGLLSDACFQGVCDDGSIKTRLAGARERDGRPVRYFFGSWPGRDGKKHLGVERVGRVVGGEVLGNGAVVWDEKRTQLTTRRPGEKRRRWI